MKRAFYILLALAFHTLIAPGAGLVVSGPYSYRTAVVTNAVAVTNGWQWNTVAERVVSMPGSQVTTNVLYNVSAGPVPTNDWNYHVYTNSLARSTGRTPTRFLWGAMPPVGTTNAPTVQWDPNGCFYGWKGATGIAVWNSSSGGQVIFTAVTRRHAYCAGHQVYNGGHVGELIWYLGTNNVPVPMWIQDSISNADPSHPWGGATNMPNTSVSPWEWPDVSIVMFSNDLPSSVEVMSVVNKHGLRTADNVLRAVDGGGWPSVPDADGRIVRPADGWVPWIATCQHLYAYWFGAEIAKGTNHTYYQGGDSGAPQCYLVNNQLVLFSGTSGGVQSDAMQFGIDELCRRAGIDTNLYRLNLVDLKNP